MTHSFGNLDSVESQSFEPLPKGHYRLRAIELEMKDTKNGDGAYLKATFEVMEGQYENRRIWQNFNLVNKNAKAVEIALSKIKDWLTATGLPASGELTMERINQLEGKAFTASLGIERDKTGQYEDKNKIVGFVVTNTSGETAASTDPSPTTENKRPWE